eukprot:5643441-Pleurochrysis_carterae.AAC.1
MVWTSKSPSLETSSSTSIEEGSRMVPNVPVSFGTDTADTPTESASHELRVQEQTQEVLAEIDAVFHTSPTGALDREAPFGGGGR